MIQRALLSVSDKSGIVQIARRLQKKNIQIIATGGTAKALIEAGVSVTLVEDITSFPECFSGRLKTLHPILLGGILMRRGPHFVYPELVEGRGKGDEEEAKKLGIKPIDLVIVNLYPFEEAKEREEAKESKEAGNRCSGGVCVPRNPAAREQFERALVELIDVGGPTLLRAAAKNFESVTVVCDPHDYERVLQQIEATGETTPALCKELAAKVFLHTASYDAAITEYLSGGGNKGVLLTEGKDLRYGENPHQWGRVYSCFVVRRAHHDIAQHDMFTMHQGKELSYLNILDADAAHRMVLEFLEPTAVFVKHANPSGIASHASIEEAFQRGYDADRLSAFGVIIALNRPCTEAIARKIIEQQIFVEVLIAPAYEGASLALLKQKPKVRILEVPADPLASRTNAALYRSAFGGMLVQNDDASVITEKDLTCVTTKKPTEEQVRDLLFAWKVVKHAKSNAIVFAKDRVTIGIGSGQTSRVDATWIAAKRAGAKAKGAVLASDAFFPFPDSVEEAGKHGIAAIIQPGGSIRDSEVIAKADELGIAMVVTGVRAFRH